MAFAAARTSAGTKRQVNEDACCIEVAETPLGEVLMAIVCDGVGGLSRGNVASSTVVDRFVAWFERELPALMEAMVEAGRFDFGTVKAVWGVLLQDLNELIRTHGVRTGSRLGTTFTGVVACGGRYLVGHVGDCRAFCMSAGSFEQVTEDQTLVARQLANGEITEEEARRAPKNVILQAVGSQRVLTPVFYEGILAASDLFVICCDGAYHRAGNEGIRKLFQPCDYRNEKALASACETLLQFDMDCGEKDNLTVACFCGALAGAGETAEKPARARPAVVAAPVDDEDDAPTMVEADEDDVATMVASEEPSEDDLPTMVESDEDEDDMATMVADDEGPDEDDLPTMVEADEDPDEDDLATMVADDEDPDEDDLATMVADDEYDWDEDDEDDDDFFGAPAVDLPTFSSPEGDEDEDEDEEAAWASDFEDDAPTMVAGDEPDERGAFPLGSDPEEDDLPTMVEGGDA